MTLSFLTKLAIVVGYFTLLCALVLIIWLIVWMLAGKRKAKVVKLYEPLEEQRN